MEGKHEGITAIVGSIVTILFIHKLPCGLKYVHSLLDKQQVLEIMDQSLEKDFLNFFS